jgi:hypothetical protein
MICTLFKPKYYKNTICGGGFGGVVLLKIFKQLPPLLFDDLCNYDDLCN